MPELPDVETWKRYVDATSLHRRIRRVEVDAPRMLKGVSGGQVAEALKGTSFESTQRHGKHLFVELSSGGWLMLHFGMTGYLRYRETADADLEKARLVVWFGGERHLAGFWQRRLGQIGLVDSPGDFAREEGLGPDALDPEIDLARFREMLGARRGSVKSALMDQGFLAGIGNVYSDEILFQAGLHPKAAARELDEGETRSLYRAMHHVLDVAIECQAEPERMPDSWILPRRSEGERCPRCKGEVQPIKISGRTAYYCPACQGG